MDIRPYQQLVCLLQANELLEVGALDLRTVRLQAGRLHGGRLQGGGLQAGQLASLSSWLGRSDRAVPGWAMAAAFLSPVVLTGGWLVADALQPPSYSPVRQTVSILAGQAGTDRWVMTAALFLVGGCHLLTAAGLTGLRRPARLLLVVAGLASIGIAASPEPAGGVTPQHLAWTSLGAVTIAVWPAFAAARTPAAARTSARPLILGRHGAAVATALFLALLGWLVIETQGGSALGLAERLTSSVQTTWPFIVAVALRRSTRQAGARRRCLAPAAGRDHAVSVSGAERDRCDISSG